MPTMAPSILGKSFWADGKFGSQANFSRVDLSNSSYYDFGRDHWVIARQTRYGQERSFGNGDEQLIPLPERLYAGGATSHRGFPINSAGPRDPQTGYPVGGAAVFVNTLELRTPAPALRWVGTDLSFVLFHDMGNAFENVFTGLARRFAHQAAAQLYLSQCFRALHHVQHAGYLRFQ